MAIESLNLTYALLDKEIELYSKTGIYHSSHNKYGKSVIIPKNDSTEWFKCSHGIKYINAKQGDKISIGLFGKNGGMFVIYNHNNYVLKVFPEAVNDLYGILNLKAYNFIQKFQIQKKIKQTAKRFPNSSILLQAIFELKNK